MPEPLQDSSVSEAAGTEQQQQQQAVQQHQQQQRSHVELAHPEPALRHKLALTKQQLGRV
jgi:hypothetical protein